MTVVNFEPARQSYGTLKGFATVYLDDLGFQVSGIRYSRRERDDWVQLPCRRVEEDGVVQWVPNISFPMRDAHEKFVNDLADAIGAHWKENGYE
jgi:hypothetical protein